MQTAMKTNQGTGETRQLVTRKGREVVTTFTDQEAWDVCAALKNDSFAQDLTSRGLYKLSAEQVIWLHIKAVEATKPKPSPVSLGNLERIKALFGKAGQKLKSPAIHLMTEGDIEVKLFIGSDYSKFPGRVYVGNANRDRYCTYGTVNEAGEYEPIKENRDVLAILLRFAADPEGVAAEFGRLTGRCCFCNTALTDQRSVDVGYGPVCAKNYGLFWGKKPAAQASQPTSQLELVAA